MLLFTIVNLKTKKTNWIFSNRKNEFVTIKIYNLGKDLKIKNKTLNEIENLNKNKIKLNYLKQKQNYPKIKLNYKENLNIMIIKALIITIFISFLVLLDLSAFEMCQKYINDINTKYKIINNYKTFKKYNKEINDMFIQTLIAHLFVNFLLISILYIIYYLFKFNIHPLIGYIVLFIQGFIIYLINLKLKYYFKKSFKRKIKL